MSEISSTEIEAALAALTISSQPSAIKTLATASRHSESARHALSNPNILRNIIETIETSLTTDLESTDQALRLLANACVSSTSDPGPRDHITNIGFSWALQCLSPGVSGSADAEIRVLTTKVLRNICSEHEAAQKKCYESRVHFALIRFLHSQSRTSDMEGLDDLEAAIDVLFLLMGQKDSLEPKFREPLPRDVLNGVFSMQNLWTGQGEEENVETFATIVETMLVILRDEVVHAQIVTEGKFSDVWRLLEKIEVVVANLKAAKSRITEIDDTNEQTILAYCSNGNVEEDLKLLMPLQASLVWCLSDIAAYSEFAAAYAWGSTEMRGMAHIVQAAAQNARSEGGLPRAVRADETSATGQKLNAACQVLGNVLWAQKQPEDFASLVKEDELHKDLIDIVALGGFDPAIPDTLHSIAGVLLQLTRPSLEACELMGSYEPAFAAVETFCRHERAEIKQLGLKLIKALARNCPANQQQFGELAEAAIAGLQPPRNDHAGDTDSVMATDGPS